MLDRRMRCSQQCLAPFLGFGERHRIVRVDRSLHSCIELDRPVVSALGVVPIDPPQIVDDVASA